MIARVTLLVALLSLSPAALAHPTATTDVSMTIGASTIDVTLTSDAETLRVKLAALQRSLGDCIDLRLDGAPATLQIIDRVAVAAGREAMHLRAAIPAGAAPGTRSSPPALGSHPGGTLPPGPAAATPGPPG